MFQGKKTIASVVRHIFSLSIMMHMIVKIGQEMAEILLGEEGWYLSNFALDLHGQPKSNHQVLSG